jgi:hypothetical protein
MIRSLLPVSSSPSPFLCNYSWQQERRRRRRRQQWPRFSIPSPSHSLTPVKFLSSASSSPVSLCPLDTNATRLVGSIVSFVADFAKPNAGRNIYQIDPWQCKESNGTPIENSSRRSTSTVVSTTNRQPYVCVCVCEFFKLLRQKSTQTLRHISGLFLRVPLYRGYRSSSDRAPAGRAF